MDHWVPTVVEDKKDNQILDFIENTLNYEISPEVHVYEL